MNAFIKVSDIAFIDKETEILRKKSAFQFSDDRIGTGCQRLTPCGGHPFDLFNGKFVK